MNGQFRIINSQMSLDAALKEISDKWQELKWLIIQITTEKQRSELQNRSLHMWLEWVAQELNNNGLDVREVLSRSKRMEIPWTQSAVKEHLWRPVQQAYMGKSSTTKASTKDYPAVYDVLNKALTQQFGIYVPWPCKQNMRSAA